MIDIEKRLPYNQKLIERAREMRKNMTYSEQKLWDEFLSDFQKIFQIRVLRQRPISNFIVDFYIAKASLVIEIDWESHFDEQWKAYDQERTEILVGYGLKVLRFTNDEVLNDFESVCSKITQQIWQNL